MRYSETETEHVRMKYKEKNGKEEEKDSLALWLLVPFQPFEQTEKHADVQTCSAQNDNDRETKGLCDCANVNWIDPSRGPMVSKESQIALISQVKLS